MKNPEKNHETFLQTIIRTGLTATIISIVLYSFHIIPSSGKSELKEFRIIWAAVFSIVFVGHWFELFSLMSLNFNCRKIFMFCMQQGFSIGLFLQFHYLLLLKQLEIGLTINLDN